MSQSHRSSPHVSPAGSRIGQEGGCQDELEEGWAARAKEAQAKAAAVTVGGLQCPVPAEGWAARAKEAHAKAAEAAEVEGMAAEWGDEAVEAVREQSGDPAAVTKAKMFASPQTEWRPSCAVKRPIHGSLHSMQRRLHWHPAGSPYLCEPSRLALRVASVLE